MLGRTFFVILFFWAALTVITPILIRLSASANPGDYNYNGEMKNGGIQSIERAGLLSRRALGSIESPQKERLAPSPSPSPSPSSESHKQTTFELENSTLTHEYKLRKLCHLDRKRNNTCRGFNKLGGLRLFGARTRGMIVGDN